MTGTNSTGTMLLMAHYDSVATGPGAADNGSGVVTLLETLRALRSSAQLRNDVVFVFTDGEEDGSLGAQAFLDEHPWAKDLSVAMVADSGGSCGPVSMGVLDHHNGWLVRESTKALPHPLAASISDEIYRLAGPTANGDQMPLYQKGVPVLALGFNACQITYHTMQDKLSNLDLRAVQDLGTYELDLARHFGNLDLKHISQDDVVYFPFFGHIISYSANWVILLTVVTLIVLVAAVLLGLKRKILTSRSMAFGFLLWAIGTFAVGGFIAFFWRLLLSLHQVNRSFISAYNAQAYALAFLALAAAIASSMYAAFRQKIGTQNLIAGAFLFCGALMLLTYVFAPDATYLPMWPLLIAALPFACGFALNQTDFLSLRVSQLLCAVPAIALFVPLIGYMGITTGDLAQTFTIIGILTAILFALLAPQVETMGRTTKCCSPERALSYFLVSLHSAS